MTTLEQILLLCSLFGLAFLWGSSIKHRRRADILRDQLHDLAKRFNRLDANQHVMRQELDNIQKPVNKNNEEVKDDNK